MVRLRSIPACAGASYERPLGGDGTRVYPRVCGGIGEALVDGRGKGGLSPRVRGHLPERFAASMPLGSIPACAGASTGEHESIFYDTVYPRVCGGIPVRSGKSVGLEGLSPRVRGHQIDTPNELIGLGSIPACAGASRVRAPSPPPVSVYPRVCGGILHGIYQVLVRQGLSPRVRGHLAFDHRRAVLKRSIPACAGASA